MDPRRLLPVLAALACACVVATVVVTLARTASHPVPPPDGASSRAEPAASSTADRARSGPGAILARWDEQRAAAWAQGDGEMLEELYVDGSRTGAADLKLLRHYVERGLTVHGLTTQVLALEVVSQGARRLVLLVTDRLVGGTAVSDASRVALPTARATTRRIVLERRDGRWLVAEARAEPDAELDAQPDAQPSAAANTSRTSSSSKS